MQDILLRVVAALQTLRHDERAQGLVEYALILVFISVVVIAILGALGGNVNNVLNQVSNALGNAPG